MPHAFITALRHLLNGISYGLSFALIFLLSLGVFLIQVEMTYIRPGPLPFEKTLQIPSGYTLSQIAHLLKNEGLIKHPLFFMTSVLTRKNIRLKAGEYAFAPRISMREIVTLLHSGRSVLYPLTIPEGWSSQQVVETLEMHPLLEGPIKALPAEGKLLPETYYITRGEKRQAVLERMEKAQNVLLAYLWETRNPDLPFSRPEELVILASIIEKEAGTAAEFKKIASVFLNRLSKNMRLQADSTILYGIYEGLAWKQSRTITKSQIRSQTPYNTYVIHGLPPEPIANPGKAALAAVAHPEKTTALYFVADGKGGHVFSENYAEHQKNVRSWRRAEKRDITQTEIVTKSEEDDIIQTEIVTESLPRHRTE